LAYAGSENVSVYLEVADGSDLHVDRSALARLIKRSQSSQLQSNSSIVADDSQRFRLYHEIFILAFMNEYG
jgi:hypothetical protein